MTERTSPVSIIIPLYNKADYIGRALDSVLAQTYRDFELIVVDDGSDDIGPEIVAGCRDERVRLIRQANTGPGAARNHGMRESQGRYIAFLDADDEFMPPFLEVALGHLADNTDCDLCRMGHRRSHDGSPWPGFRILSLTAGTWRMPPELRSRRSRVAVDLFSQAGSILYRRGILERFTGFYENHCTYGEDTYLGLQIALNCRAYIEPRPLFCYHTESSELGVGRATLRPPWPMLTDPEPIRACCPAEYQPLLEDYLAYHAVAAAEQHAGAGRGDIARDLIKKYPLAGRYYWQCCKLKMKLACPGLTRWIRRLKHRL